MRYFTPQCIIDFINHMKPAADLRNPPYGGCQFFTVTWYAFDEEGKLRAHTSAPMSLVKARELINGLLDADDVDSVCEPWLVTPAEPAE